MTEFKAFNSSDQVLGAVISVYSAGFPQGLEKMGSQILEKHGMKDVAPEKWYPLQNFLDALKEIAEKASPHMLTRMGWHIAQSVPLPPEMDSLEKCMEMMEGGYLMSHRGNDVGKYYWTDEGVVNQLKRGKMVVQTPYSCAADLGSLEGFAQRFKPKESVDVIVRHDDSQPCRAKGADSCTYLISWG